MCKVIIECWMAIIEFINLPHKYTGEHTLTMETQTIDAFTHIRAWYPCKHAYITKSIRQFTDSVYWHVYANEHSLFSQGFNAQKCVVFGHECAVYFLGASNVYQ